ncbi:MAG: type II toxin-antitoxin system Phd/YefM family antitoxin [Clostridia bacterium]|nr:type II toxin-antitoxin system Phd/YefM family antitoxin [Clostridia bacterium]
MNINTKQIVSISEANQNFSKVARMVEKNGEVYIFKNNRPKYRLVDLESDTTVEMTDEEKIDFVAARLLKQYRRAFEELAK